MAIQNLQDVTKEVLSGKFIAIQSYLKKPKTSQIKNLSLNLKQLQMEEQTQPEVSKRKEVIDIRAEINDIEMKKQQQRSMKLKAGSLTF